MKYIVRNIIIAIIVLYTFNIFASKKEYYSFHSSGKVEITNISGKIDIKRGKKNHELEIKTIKSSNFDESDCKIFVNKINNKLFKLEVKKLKNKSMIDCTADLKLKVPVNTSAKVINGRGEIDIEDITGDVHFTNGSGEVEIEGDVKNIVGKNGHGKVEIERFKGSANISVGSGKVEIKYSEIPKKGLFKLALGSGDIKISLPDKSHFKTKFSSGSGKFTNKIGHYNNSNFLFDVQTGSADLKIVPQ